MSSRLQRAVFYIRDRIVNAAWMLREGRFSDVYHNLLLELRTRGDQVGAALAPEDLPIQRSGGLNPCRPDTPSPRPDLAIVLPERAPDITHHGRVAATLQALLEKSTAPGEGLQRDGQAS